MKNLRPQVKICGLTRVDEAVACARAGADAIGLVFYPPSPRHVSVATAGEIAAALPPAVAKVGVFVDAPKDTVLETARAAGLTAVQLHGGETPAMVAELKATGLMVIKALFAAKAPGVELADTFGADAVLFEQGAGRLPGGNAEIWDYSLARRSGLIRRSDLGRKQTLGPPLILAGGLAPDNVTGAIAKARPDAIDLSSGVEASPGRKQIELVKSLMAAVDACGSQYGDTAVQALRRIF
jgi:phosphoribosylanthranilate isomerase